MALLSLFVPSAVVASLLSSATVSAFLPHSGGSIRPASYRHVLQDEFVETTTTQSPDPQTRKHWELAPTNFRAAGPLTPELRRAMENNEHPEETQEDLGNGVFVTSDWREAWYTYESPPDDPDLIDPDTGYSSYEISPEDIEGELPEDLVGTLYRNGPGKFGVGGERVQHVLDADGLVFKVHFGKPGSNGKREISFKSRFVETKEHLEERKTQQFMYRGTFGTSPPAWFDTRKPDSEKYQLNDDPTERSVVSKVAGSLGKLDIKNSANTQVISFGGKLLALFEAGLPHRLDPETLNTIGEDTLGGILKPGIPVSLGNDAIPTPDFIGGTAHTAHPQRCGTTGNLVGWHWSQVASRKSMEVTFTEWSDDNGMAPIASYTYEIPNVELAPHDMAITDDYIILKANRLQMNQAPFLLGVKGPAASLEMDGQGAVTAWVFPRPTSKLVKDVEPFPIEMPACFSIHFSHAYQDEETGNLVAYFSGWPPSDSKDFLGAWGGFAPLFSDISPTFLWRMELDMSSRTCVSLDVAPNSDNVCAEHPLVHPNFNTRKAQNVYASCSNLVGDSTAPCGYARLEVESPSKLSSRLKPGERNLAVDAYFFGTRCFSGEPLIVPKSGGDLNDERDAFLIGVGVDSTTKKSFLAIFDLQRNLREGPVCKIWLKARIPHGLHGCFAEEGGGGPSVFC